MSFKHETPNLCILVLSSDSVLEKKASFVIALIVVAIDMFE